MLDNAVGDVDRRDRELEALINRRADQPDLDPGDKFEVIAGYYPVGDKYEILKQQASDINVLGRMG